MSIFLFDLSAQIIKFWGPFDLYLSSRRVQRHWRSAKKHKREPSSLWGKWRVRYLELLVVKLHASACAHLLNVVVLHFFFAKDEIHKRPKISSLLSDLASYETVPHAATEEEEGMTALKRPQVWISGQFWYNSAIYNADAIYFRFNGRFRQLLWKLIFLFSLYFNLSECGNI